MPDAPYVRVTYVSPHDGKVHRMTLTERQGRQFWNMAAQSIKETCIFEQVEEPSDGD